jgi:3-dehydroquinate synthase
MTVCAAPEWFEAECPELAARIGELAPEGRFVVLSDRTLVEPAVRLVEEFERHGRVARRIDVDAGETSKTPEQLSRLWSAVFAGPVDRDDVVVCVGGGVVTDLGGFVAATVMRGVRVIHVATTFMAMVDAAIGGKTGIDLPEGKNLVGAFHMPEAVFAWAPRLQTLPQREWRSGLAEVVKCAIIEGEAPLAWMESAAGALERRDPSATREAFDLAVGCKVRCVNLDPRERGVRRLLNLGHTFGHAIEVLTGYAEFTHGEAVAKGLSIASACAVEVGGDPMLQGRVERLLARLGLDPGMPRAWSASAWVAAMSRDKKRAGDGIRLVLPLSPGRCEVRAVPLPITEFWIDRLLCGKEGLFGSP